MKMKMKYLVYLGLHEECTRGSFFFVHLLILPTIKTDVSETKTYNDHIYNHDGFVRFDEEARK